jgi:hypothetical protein
MGILGKESIATVPKPGLLGRGSKNCYSWWDCPSRTGTRKGEASPWETARFHRKQEKRE